MSIKERLKSPVVQIQLISILAGAIVFYFPEISESVKYGAGVVIAIINILAGLNDPTNSVGF